MGVIKDGLDSLGKMLSIDKNKKNRRSVERRKASKRERVIFYAKVFTGDAVDRRSNLFDRRQTG